MRRPTHLIAVVVAGGTLAACGSTSGGANTLGAPTTTVLPALATRPAATGEIVVRGEGSPASKGPYAFEGRYRVRFEQYAPEDPKLDFAAQTPFSAQVAVRAEDPRGALALFEDAAPRGREDVEIHGSRYVEVTFGDFPWVLRFTPRRGR